MVEFIEANGDRTTGQFCHGRCQRLVEEADLTVRVCCLSLTTGALVTLSQRERDVVNSYLTGMFCSQHPGFTDLKDISYDKQMGFIFGQLVSKVRALMTNRPDKANRNIVVTITWAFRSKLWKRFTVLSALVSEDENLGFAIHDNGERSSSQLLSNNHLSDLWILKTSRNYPVAAQKDFLRTWTKGSFPSDRGVISEDVWKHALNAVEKHYPRNKFRFRKVLGDCHLVSQRTKIPKRALIISMTDFHATGLVPSVGAVEDYDMRHAIISYYNSKHMYVTARSVNRAWHKYRWIAIKCRNMTWLFHGIDILGVRKWYLRK